MYDTTFGGSCEKTRRVGLRGAIETIRSSREPRRGFQTQTAASDDKDLDPTPRKGNPTHDVGHLNSCSGCPADSSRYLTQFSAPPQHEHPTDWMWPSHGHHPGRHAAARHRRVDLPIQSQSCYCTVSQSPGHDTLKSYRMTAGSMAVQPLQQQPQSLKAKLSLLLRQNSALLPRLDLCESE